MVKEEFAYPSSLDIDMHVQRPSWLDVLSAMLEGSLLHKFRPKKLEIKESQELYRNSIIQYPMRLILISEVLHESYGIPHKGLALRYSRE